MDAGGTVGKHCQSLKPLKVQRNTMEKQGLLMRGCWWNRWKALETFTTIDKAKKYYGEAMIINAEMLVELLESIENLQNHCNYKEILWKSNVYQCGDTGGTVGKS